MKVQDFVKNEIVLIIAWLLAIISVFIVPIDSKYLTYIDLRTLALLFCLMLVISGFSKSGIFTYIANKLLTKFKTIKGIIFVLTFLCFVFSMLITNDVALITFVPFAMIVLRLAKSEKYIIKAIALQTVAANLGSMLTPMGNPQNLYLYTKSQIPPLEFINLMLPYTLACAALLLISILFIKNSKPEFKVSAQEIDKKSVIYMLVLFVISFLSVVHILDYRILVLIISVAIFIKDKSLFKRVDYSLLLTFVGFFIFIGNISRINSFSNFISSALNGNEIIISIILSQVLSNVPTALLLSGFSNNYHALIIGTNLGGLGTLIASMASLISYKQLAKNYPELKGRYMLEFSIVNVVFLCILAGCHLVIFS